MACRYLVLLPLLGVQSLHLEVFIHYPEQASAVELCGFKFSVSTSLGNPDETAAVPAKQRSDDLFAADVHLPESNLDKEAVIGVMADFEDSRRDHPACVAVCPNLSPQGKVVQTGAFHRTSGLKKHTVVELWPTFCRYEGATYTAAFHSHALDRDAKVRFRLPAASLENPLPRPTRLVPPIIFRLNSEWYWPNEDENNQFWQDLMSNGRMESVVMAELYIHGVDHNSWDNQPIYTPEDLRQECRKCHPELGFICESWKTSYLEYVGDDHNYGSAKKFFKELYEKTIPLVLGQLPARTDDKILRVGAWGYCIGGLGAWSAITTNPELFNMAYLGSPAVDFNCGDAFNSVSAVRKSTLKPKIYIDCGAAEGELMNNQTLLLFQKLQAEGLDKDKDVFYHRAPFGTHQGNSLLRRSTAGLLALFGTDHGRLSDVVTDLNGKLSSNVSLSSLEPPVYESMPAAWAIAFLACLAGAFATGRWSVSRGTTGSGQPLLG